MAATPISWTEAARVRRPPGTTAAARWWHRSPMAEHSPMLAGLHVSC